MRLTAGHLGRFFASVGAILVLLVAVPAGLVTASRARFDSANPLHGVEPPWAWDIGAITDSLRSPLSDDVVTDLLIRTSLVIVWGAAAIVLVTIVLEVVHLNRHRGLSLPTVRGIGWAQSIARVVAAGLIVVVPLMTTHATLAQSGSQPLSPTATATSVIDLDGSMSASGNLSIRSSTGIDGGRSSGRFVHEAGSGDAFGAPQTSSFAARRTMQRSQQTHVVQQGESIYGISETLAADVSMETADIADRILDLNLGNEMPDGQRFTNPAYIEIGWELTIPGEVLPPISTVPVATPMEAGGDDVAAIAVSHVVVAGETLSGIAEQHLGDADAWPQIFAANEGDDMGGGRSFLDPDFILPGWDISVPQAAAIGTPDDDSSVVATPTVETVETVEVAAPAIEIDEPTIETPPPAPDVQVAGTEAPGTSGEVAPASSATPTSSTTTTTPDVADAGVQSNDQSGESAPSPIQIEHAALLAAGVLALVGVRRRHRLRSATPRARVPLPPTDVIATERRLRTIDAGERSTRADVAIRAAAHSLVDTDARIGAIVVDQDGAVEIHLSSPGELPGPWVPVGERRTAWQLPANVPVEMLSADARRVGTPCIALVQLGVADGRDVLVDLEACGVLAIEAATEQVDEIISALAAGIATSPYAEIAHLITVALPGEVALGHRNAHEAATAGAALELATSLVGTTISNERSTFSLRSLRTGGEMWEPAVVLLGGGGSGDDDHDMRLIESWMPVGGHGVGLVTRAEQDQLTTAPARLVGTPDGWTFSVFDASLCVTPVGLSAADLEAISAVLADASAPLEEVDERTVTTFGAAMEAASNGMDLADGLRWSESGTGGFDPSTDDAESTHDVPRSHDVDDTGEPGEPGESGEPDHLVQIAASTEPGDDDIGDRDAFVDRDHEIIVCLMGAVEVLDRVGNPGVFERSKTVELIAWLATHRQASTRSAARTALWDLDVRDATFANVVSEARRSLGRLVSPINDEEWVGRTLTERLPLHAGVITDAELMEARLAAARLQSPTHAIATLRPAAELIRDLPFAGTSYLWPDAEGITSNLVLLATGVSTELAAHALSLGDTDLVFWATGQGLRVLPGHEELIGLRMHAHARAGDLAGVRHEWESYERIIVADAWSDGEPAPKLVALRHELLSNPQ